MKPMLLSGCVFVYSAPMVNFADEAGHEATICRARFGLVARCWALEDRRLSSEDDAERGRVLLQAAIAGLSAN